jgi:hypothetical protein
MNTKAIFLWVLLGGLLPLPVCSWAEIELPGDGAAPSKANSTEENLYADATRAINESRWSDAAALFNRVIQQHGTRTEGALYWEAYAENKQGHPSDALKTCMELRRAYQKSRWLDECSALEIEIRGRSDQPVQPQSEPNDDLKLLALNSLMQSDEARALPIIRQILNGNASEKLKDRALFVLTQNNSKQAQDLLGQIARGQTNPALQVRAINRPIHWLMFIATPTMIGSKKLSFRHIWCQGTLASFLKLLVMNLILNLPGMLFPN